MVTVRFSVESALPARTILAAATDFTARRPDLWPTLSRRYYLVHELKQTSAEATEGSEVLGGIWARELYDWSSPGIVRAEVRESNVFRPGSSWELRVRPRPDGGSSLEWTTRRRTKGKGRVIGFMLRLAGRRVLSRNLQATLDILDRAEASA